MSQHSSGPTSDRGEQVSSLARATDPRPGNAHGPAPVRTHAPVPARGRGVRIFDEPQLLALHAEIGNRAVCRIVDAAGPKRRLAQPVSSAPAATAVVRTAAIAQRAPGGRADQTANIAKLTGIRSTAESPFKLATDYSSGSLAVGDAVKDKLTTLSVHHHERGRPGRAAGSLRR